MQPPTVKPMQIPRILSLQPYPILVATSQSRWAEYGATAFERLIPIVAKVSDGFGVTGSQLKMRTLQLIVESDDKGNIHNCHKLKVASQKEAGNSWRIFLARQQWGLDF